MAVVDYKEAELAAALEYLRGRRSLRAAWKVQGHLKSDQYLDERESLLPLSRVMTILTHLLLPVQATNRCVQNQSERRRFESGGLAEFTGAGIWNDSSNVASIR